MNTSTSLFVRAARLGSLVPLLIAGFTGACGSSGSSSEPDPNGPGTGVNAQTPPPMADRPVCIISADCPAGEHCDLGECTQACNTVDPCTGALTCSPRARCTPPGVVDSDPTPTATYLGAVSASPSTAMLSGSDTSFQVTLTSTSKDPVRYRVELSAPHLSITASRGEFTGSTTLTFAVSSAALKGRDVAGSIKVHTTLGDVVVSAPIHNGVTGKYHGSLRYDGGAVSLGDTRIGLEILETSGDVSLHVVSGESLLFPAGADGDVTGHGSFTVSAGVDVTIAQRIDHAVGGERNHFQRDLGRKLRLQVKPTQKGNLEGTFEETVYGLFSEPVKLTGHAVFEYETQSADPSFRVGDEASMPASPSKDTWLSPSVFGWAEDTACSNLVCAGGSCSPTIPAAIAKIEAAYAKPLNAAMIVRDGSAPFVPIVTACSKSLTAGKRADATPQCGLVAPVACAMSIAATVTTADTAMGKTFGRLVSETVAPALLVAKDHVVGALGSSFISGISAEAARYDAAMKALGPTATWVVQPAALEYLRSMSPDAARGDLPGVGDTTTVSDTYPSARAMADLFATMSTIEGERARIGAASVGTDPTLALKAQERALVTYLEAAALAEIVREWGSVPPSVRVKYVGMLNPLDSGFTALSKGANAFGVPVGFVPFVYQPEAVSKGSTNFEQELAAAMVEVSSEKAVELRFMDDKRTCDLNAKDLQNQLKSVRDSYDKEFATACGTSFKPDATASSGDWSTCGKDDAGDVGVSSLDVQVVIDRLHASQARLQGMKDKIAIDQRALADTQRVHEATLTFLDKNGKQVEALTLAEGVFDAEMKAIEVASHAQVLNGGAPLGEAAVELAIGLMKTQLEVQKVQLQTAQSMRMESASKEVELIAGMANIQKEVVDLAQLGVEMQGDVLAVLQSQVRLRNMISNERRTLDERQKTLALIDKDPSNDPSFRILRDDLALAVVSARARAQREMYLAATALEYEINQQIPAIEGAVINAHNGASLEALAACYTSILNDARKAYGAPQEYAATISVRQLLGITAPRTDSVTGVTLSAGDQFRELLLQNQNLDGQGGVGVTFATNLLPGNRLWSSDVCNDRIEAVQAQLVGDFLGDNQAQVNIAVAGNALVRSCDTTSVDALQTWSLGSSKSASDGMVAVIQAGVNSFGDAPRPNTSLFGQSVARSTWKLIIPGPSAAPTNADIDISKVDDIVLKVSHQAVPRHASPISLNLSCLADIGK